MIEKKLVMMRWYCPHSLWCGKAGYIMGFEPILGAFIFSIFAAIGIGYIKRKGQHEFRLIIGLFCR